MRRWSTPENIIFYVKIIIYQSGIVGSDAEMVSSAKCIFFYVKIIIYQSGSVVSDAIMVRTAKYNFFLC